MTRATVLVRDWRAATLTDAWTDPADWWTPAVDALADALATHSADASAASETLGRQRAAAGVFLDEARADVQIVGRLAGMRPGEIVELLDALTVGWVDRTLDELFTSECVDPLTELTSLPYLMTRLAEVYAEARVSAGSVSDDYALIVIHLPPASDPVVSETQMIVVQTAMRSAFAGGETLARIGPSTAVALVRRVEPRLSLGLTALRVQLELARLERRLARSRMWIERLPGERSDLPQLLRLLNA